MAGSTFYVTGEGIEGYLTDDAETFSGIPRNINGGVSVGSVCFLAFGKRKGDEQGHELIERWELQMKLPGGHWTRVELLSKEQGDSLRARRRPS